LKFVCNGSSEKFERVILKAFITVSLLSLLATRRRMAHSAGIVYWEEAEVREWLISQKIPSRTDTVIDSCGFIGVDLLTLDEQVSTFSRQLRLGLSAIQVIRSGLSTYDE
jgi:hypothetical protein